MGAIDYNFISDYLLTKEKAVDNKNKMPNTIFGSVQSTPFSTFALGGDLQSHGSDWSTGLTEVNAGGSHEESPYDGVQMGVDQEGKPNKVEEGETVYNDYVYSTRIEADAKTKELFHLPKKSKITMADISKKIVKEGEERPNDPVSQNAINKKMELLAEQQERQKQEKVQKEFEALSPEQQEAIIQQIAQQQQAAQQEAIQQQEATQAPEEQPVQEDANQQLPEQQEEALPFAEQQEEPEMEEQEEQVNAYGGNLFGDGGNLFPDGGTLKQKIFNYIKAYTDGDFNKWAKENNVDISKLNWEDFDSLKDVINAATKKDSILKHAVNELKYNFDTYKPEEEPLSIDFLHGGWGKEGYSDWNGSTDPVWVEAVKEGKVKEGMTPEEIGKALQTTKAYKRGTEWLQASPENRLRYLQAIYNSKDAPPDAVAYASKFVDANGWKEGSKQDYKTIFEDPDGVGVRNTHPGTYWKTPTNIDRDNVEKDYVLNADGSVEEITGVRPKDWKLDRTLTWADKAANHKANYYLRPTEVSPETTDKKPADTPLDAPVVSPKLKDESLRTWAPIMESVTDTLMRSFGVGSPKKMWDNYDKAVNTASQAPALANHQVIGNYLKLNPMDVWSEQNRLNANTRATDRAILNNNASIGTKMSGLLASEYNNQVNSGDLFRKALEYNDANRVKEAEFNRGTDMFNAQGHNQVSIANAQAKNQARQAAAAMQMQSALHKMEDYASWNKGYYNNMHSLYNTLGQIGKENAQHNMIARMAADNLLGNASDKQNIFRDYLTFSASKRAKGGKIRRKR